MNPLAQALNQTIAQQEPAVLEMLAPLGKALYYPKGILSQTAEAKQKATRFNATIGMAKEAGHAMHLQSILAQFPGHTADEIVAYAPATGHPVLRRNWLNHIKEKNPSLGETSTSLPIVTNGITHGISLVADLFAGPDDVLLLPDQFWGNYAMVFAVRHGARIEKYPFFNATGFNVDALHAAIETNRPAGKLIVLLNFPNNPTGYSITEAEAQAISQVLIEAAASGLKIVAVTDDAYFDLFYEDEVYPESLFGLIAGRHENLLAIKLDGATKENFVWGFRLGFITFASGRGNPEVLDALEKKTGGAIRGNISNCALPSQTALLKAMSDPQYEAQKRAKCDVLKARALKVKSVVTDPKYADLWTPYPFNSGYFMCIKLTGIEAEAFRVQLLDDYQIGTIATTAQDIRIAFSCVEVEDVEALFEAMADCAKAMKG